MKIAAIYGATCVGKSTILKRFLELCPNYIFYPEFTTRPIRPGEVDKQDYIFTNGPFLRKNNRIILTKQDFIVTGGDVWSYGFFKDLLKGSDKVIVSNHRGFYQLKNAIKDMDDVQLYSFYLDLSDEAIIKRIEAIRDRSLEETKNRFIRDYMDNLQLKSDVGTVINCENKTPTEVAIEILKEMR